MSTAGMAPGEWQRRLGALLLTASLLVGSSSSLAQPTPGSATCGDGVIDAGANEECDDGGICVGDVDAGEACTSDSQCAEMGVCVGSTKPSSRCITDGDCSGGHCVHCRPFGGDGCAVNCTLERSILFNLLPGQLESGMLVPGTSGAVVNGGLTLNLPLQGQQTLTVGNERDGHVPGVIKADSVNVPRVRLGIGGCVCVRAVAVKTCGGAVFESDGRTLSTDCSDGFGPGASVCPPDRPCTFVHGPGNFAAGDISCGGLDPVNLSYTQDCGTEGDNTGNPTITLSGLGDPGSAVVVASIAIGAVLSPCSGAPGDAYGEDGEFCTDDDPASARGIPVTLPTTTGMAMASVSNANGVLGAMIGPFARTGLNFSCDALTDTFVQNASLVGAFTLCDQPMLDDIVVVTSIVAGPENSPVPTDAPTPTVTPAPPPSATPSLMPTATAVVTNTPLPCVGDCDLQGSVTVDEILIAVNIALDNAPITACPAADASHDGNITVDEILQGVSNALNGCEPSLP